MNRNLLIASTVAVLVLTNGASCQPSDERSSTKTDAVVNPTRQVTAPIQPAGARSNNALDQGLEARSQTTLDVPAPTPRKEEIFGVPKKPSGGEQDRHAAVNEAPRLLFRFNGVLTFDDGPHPNTTPKILTALKAAGEKNAIFFFVGYRMIEYPHLVRQVLEAGYDIGYHSMYHQNLAHQSREYINQDIRLFVRTLNNVLGERYRLQLARAPYGGMTSKTAKVFRDWE
jgi:peptidoglycan/xylan/chitin deacetylase (PgdA/CDA1 family)